MPAPKLPKTIPGEPEISKEEEQHTKTARLIKGSMYGLVWRWHFFAGIIFAPIIALLAISGGIYLFKTQIENQLYEHLYQVSAVGSSTLSLTEQSNRVKEAYPDAQISAVTVSDDPKQSTRFSATVNKAASTVFVDPYKGSIIGTQKSDETFMAIIKKLHSQFVVGGDVANRLVELTACWTLILLISGLYLWWPRNRADIWGTVLPRLRGTNKRTFWRDVHAVPTFWLSLLIVLIILGGLPWSGVMGKQISNFANATNTSNPPFANNFMAKPLSNAPVTKDVAENVPWAAENLPVPYSTAAQSTVLAVEDIVTVAQLKRVDPPYTISMPKGEQGVYTLSVSASSPVSNVTMHIDQYSGHVLSDIRFADYGATAKYISLGIAFHEGHLFGWPNQLLGLIACLGLLLFVISAYTMWLKRKPGGKLGAPPKAKNPKLVRNLGIIIIALGIIMPLVGISIIIVFLLDRFVLTRIPKLKSWYM
ncbi:PepSY domain-containing protein [Paenibacillus sp. FSL H7-0331]|uniref:PepSY-associated TM helix domain-containing protein n=1 Tax=Paenibacillus sp. FSL H7-0331 TaxID=1920421 RepID=UPI0009FA1384|nr:PepSY domain-containing protein [Paenibacillus sp. FSL H7-0331]